MNINRGSEWRKWDLHFHSPASYDYGNKALTATQIIDELSKNEISVIAITDHHVIDIPLIKELKSIGMTKGITVLPGIEILSDARGEEPIHYIGLFSQDSNIDYIWGQIENNTNIKKIKGEGKKPNEVYCHLLDTMQLIRDLGGIVTIHAGKKTNGIENITHSLPHGIAQKEDIAKAIHIFEMGKETDCEGYEKHVIPYLIGKIEKHIPMIICSDNHNAGEYKAKQNLWIKADPSFEGLKQILFEPQQRVAIQKEKPDFKEDKLLIDSVQFVDATNQFNPAPIFLNENLNVIIGGKSSGKSILLYHIANTLLADRSFLKKEGIGDKYRFNKNNENFNFQITTKGGFTQLMNRPGDENSIIPEIKYIPQNYLVKLAEPQENKKGSALNKIVRDLINEDKESSNDYDDFLSKVRVNDKKRESLIDNYFDLLGKVKNLEDQLRTKSNRDILEKNIISNTVKVEGLNKSAGLTTDQIAQYNVFQKELEQIQTKRENSMSDLRKVSEFSSEVVDQLTAIQNKQTLVNNSLETAEFQSLLATTSAQLATILQSYSLILQKVEIVRTDDRNHLKIQSEVSDLFRELATKKTEVEKKLEPYLQNVEIKKQIELIVKSINDDKAAVQAIDQLNKEIAECRKQAKEEKEKLFALYRATYQEYVNIVSLLKIRTVDLEKDGLVISGLIKFNFSNFNKSLEEFSDGRKGHYKNYGIYSEGKSSLDEYDLSKLIADLESMFDSIIKGDYALVGRTEPKVAVKTLLNDYFFDYWEIKYRKDKLGEMSTGKASFVILMLIVGLSKSKAPILIDQPEDNLDNRSITSDLVEYLRNKKLERQIILVTHNPNIVVNADAENIIIANQKGQNDTETSSQYTFDYINGSLENTFAKIDTEKDLLKCMGIREHIADIVEGGKEAFKKREEKYGFK